MSYNTQSNITLTNTTEVQLTNRSGEAYVRYAETADDGSPRQLPRLHHLSEPIPSEADFISPIYFLNDRQVSDHQERVSSDDSNAVYKCKESTIATKLQNQCETDGRVVYPLFVESDAEVAFYEMRNGIKTFIRDVLDCDPNLGQWYYSGGRSLHVHLPYYITDYETLTTVKKKADEYNENNTITVDSSIYSRKNLFRLVGAIHPKTQNPKLPVSPTTSDESLQNRIARVELGEITHDNGIPHTGTDVYGHLHSEYDEQLSIETPITEQENKPDDSTLAVVWKQYNRHPVSPYACTRNGKRNIILFKPKGGAFYRKPPEDTREDSPNIDGGIFIPSQILAAFGADETFTVTDEPGRITLSETDYSKWENMDIATNDAVLIIGGQSRSSLIHKIEKPNVREIVDGLLRTDEDELQKNKREAVLDVLETKGIDWFKTQYGRRFDYNITHKHIASVAKKYDDLPNPQ